MSDSDTNDLTHVTAVVDRFVGQLAVLLVGEAQRVVDIERARLPTGVRPGDWLTLVYHGAELHQIVPDPAATVAAEQRIAGKLARLRRGEHLE